jgi:hypothetical protein
MQRQQLIPSSQAWTQSEPSASQRGQGVDLALMKAALAAASSRPSILSLNVTLT